MSDAAGIRVAGNEAGIQRCATCDATRSGPYCAACGQKAFGDRHTLRSLIRGGLGRVANLEEGLAHTVYHLFFRPGTVVHDYLAGKTVRYTHPVVYFTVGLGFFAFVSRQVSGPTGAADSDRLLTILVVPCVAAASRVVLWRARYNYAEHLIAFLYLAGHVLIVSGILYTGVSLVHPEFIGAYAFIAGIVALGYYLWAYSRVFPGRALVVAVAGLVSLIVGVVMWAVALLALVSAFRR